MLMSTTLAAKLIVVQWIYTFCLRFIQMADYVRNACSGHPRKTDPKGCNLNGAEQSVEVIAAGVLGKLVARVYFETVTVTKISVDERGQKVTPCGLLLCGLLLFRVVLVTSTSDDLTGQDARIGLDDDPIRIAALQMRDRHPRRRETGCSFEEHEADGYTV